MNHFELMSSYLPIDMLSLHGLLAGIGVGFAFIVARYFLLVAPFYFVFWKTKGSSRLGLHNRLIANDQIRFEIKWSIVSSLVFAVFGYVLAVLWQTGWTQIYLLFSDYPIWYLPVSFLLASLIHEFYFYVTHVWMHQPRWFKRLHAYHHRSIKTSPWASFSFHPGEAVIQALFLPLLVMILPMHPVVLLAYLVFMTVTAISNHLGFELISNAWLRSWFISGTHHALHHQHARGNYGLYFCFMDKFFGTEIRK